MSQQHLIVKCSLLALIAASFFAPLQAERFYPDDPLAKEPTPWPTVAPERRGLSAAMETVSNIFGDPGEQHPERGVIPAGAVNTLGEVPDGVWYVNRHYRKRMTKAELQRGSGDQFPPSLDARWEVLTLKGIGIRPGLLISDSQERLYLVQFDPLKNVEMSTGAEMVTSRFLHALGYHVPENYLVYFERDQLGASEMGEEITSIGGTRDLKDEDIDDFLRKVARDPIRGYRAVATRVPANWEGLLGPFQVFGTRSDDPNDVVPHEHRRDLRGLYVFCAWLNHTNMAAVYTMDALLEENGVTFIRHHLLDFGATLGSGDTAPKLAWEGNEPLYDRGAMVKNIIGMGIYSPKWLRVRVPRLRSIGNFHYGAFDPEKWTTQAGVAPFRNRLPDDEFWAARQVMAFSDEDIRAVVETGQYSDKRAVDWLVECLIERRNRIGATYFSKVTPLERIRVENSQLQFDDLAVEHEFAAPRTYGLEWSEFANDTEEHKSIGTPTSRIDLPAAVLNAEEGKIFAVKITAEDPDKAVTAYLRMQSEGLAVIGIDRAWPGKVLADSALDFDTGESRWGDLSVAQQELLRPVAQEYNQNTSNNLSAEEYFNSITISQRTTFYGVTHALMHTKLTDEQGESLGTAIDLVQRVERIAGQYYGRGGDQQFRLYCDLEPNARETLEKSREFQPGHENSVYHVGYPHSFRLGGKYPSVQFSVSEDESKADIDVDYRSSKVPGALFNGHLTSANSDIRAGDNAERHSLRWVGLIEWWRAIFKEEVEEEEEESKTSLLSYADDEEPIDLPPDREERVDPAELHEAAQEFLTDWLVRHERKEARHFFANRMLACVDTDDDVEDEVLRAENASEALRNIMEAANDELEDRDNLTEAINAVETWDSSDRLIRHPYEGDFALVELANEDVDEFLCRPFSGQTAGSTKLAGQEYGTYYATLFRFKVEGQEGAIFGLLWTKENGNWRIVSYEAFEQ